MIQQSPSKFWVCIKKPLTLNLIPFLSTPQSLSIFIKLLDQHKSDTAEFTVLAVTGLWVHSQGKALKSAAVWRDNVTGTANKRCLDYETKLTNTDERLTVTLTVFTEETCIWGQTHLHKHANKHKIQAKYSHGEKHTCMESVQTDIYNTAAVYEKDIGVDQ